jgi:MoxR-like ATPase
MTSEELKNRVKAAFEKFKKDPSEICRVKLRRYRTQQLREILADPEKVDVNTFNREVWRVETSTKISGKDLKGKLLGTDPLSPELIGLVNAALLSGAVELHGNCMWGSATKIYAPMIKSEQEKTNHIRQALKILNTQDIKPIEMAQQLEKLTGFGPNISTGLVMVFHPNDFAIYNQKSQEAVEKLGCNSGTLKEFQDSMGQLKQLLGAEDFLELDWFLYLLGEGRYPDVLQGIEAELIALWQSEGMSSERISPRKEAEEKARQMISAKVGQFTEDDLQKFLKLVNQDLKDKRIKPFRFGLAFIGKILKQLISQVDMVNTWIDRLWKASESELGKLLDTFWEQKPIIYAGMAFPTLILYLRDPSRFNLWVQSPLQGLKKLTGFSSSGVNSEAYFGYNDKVNELKHQYNLQPQEMDIILTLAGRRWPIKGWGLCNERFQEIYDEMKFADETDFPLELIKNWKKRLLRKKHIIIQGPPGTGKTFVAIRLAKLLVSGKYDRVDVVQFHPSYSYEDFIQGLRPKPSGQAIIFELVDGRFVEFCRQAREDSKENPWVLIIDEINRADLSRVFGELMYLLEYRDQEIPLASGGDKFKIPENVYIIGTMNTADRSIALIDHALRRRFSFIRLTPDYEVLRRHLEKFDHPAESLIAALKELNRTIDDPNYEVGISFFMNDGEKLRDHLPDIWTGEIEPYLEEYFYDQPGKVEPFRWASLSKTNLNDWVQ